MSTDKLQKFKEMQVLKKDILNLNKTDWKCICQCILIPLSEKITITKRGVFFCLMTISDDAVQRIKEYISHKNNVTV